MSCFVGSMGALPFAEQKERRSGIGEGRQRGGSGEGLEGEEGGESVVRM